ncbi:MBOAT family O-acyltransferase [Aureivirga marina]|uniref:MBOAT family O-acyltransferase n=1 Tax=Aureivirga marina TaxID=1182451 RepID=UPI0018C93676|nr:MBOAT family protein [Aureivirga marina]
MNNIFLSFFQNLTLENIGNWLTYNSKEPLIFSSVLFFVVFILFFLVYQAIQKKINLRIYYVTIFSLYFYYKSSGVYFGLLIFSSIVDFYLGKLIYETEEKSRRKLYLIASLIINLGLLAYFKYTNFFIDNINQILESNFAFQDIFLPIGISFFTFQTMSYSIDLYRKEMKPAESFWDFLFFVSFFPQLVAGPIVRAADFIPQIRGKYFVSNENFNRAFVLIIGGLFKKAVIADYISINFVDRVFDNPMLYSPFENLMAVYGYTIQIYCDFSGYSDMAIGLALLLGFTLPENFRTPYNSLSITEFWRRWHISLSSWLRDYLYISMGGNRKGTMRTYMNLFMTMFLGGLWHGAAWKFVFWGAGHGIALIYEKLCKNYYLTLPKNPITKPIFWFLTFHFVAFLWIYFRADSFQTALDIVTNITHLAKDFSIQNAVEILTGYKYVFLLIGIGYFLHFMPVRFLETLENMNNALPWYGKSAILGGLCWLVYIIASAEIQPFIYFQF